MKKRLQILLGGLVIVVGAVLVWHFVIPREPGYQGRSLTEWLEEYHQAGSMEKAAPVDEAIRAMGTNILPFLVKYMRAEESPMMRNLSDFLQKQSIVKIPNYEPNRYSNPSILAVRALGADAASIVPDLWPDYFREVLWLNDNVAAMENPAVAVFESLGLHAVSELMKLYPTMSDIEKDWLVEMGLGLQVSGSYRSWNTELFFYWQTTKGFGQRVRVRVLATSSGWSGLTVGSPTAIWSRVSDPDIQFLLLEKLERTIDRAEGHLDSIPEFENDQLLQLLEEAANGSDPRVSGVATRVLQKLNAEIVNPVPSLKGQE